MIDTRDRPDLFTTNDPGNALHRLFAIVMIACSILLDYGPGLGRVTRRGQVEV